MFVETMSFTHHHQSVTARSHSQHLASVFAVICWDSSHSYAVLASFPGHKRNALTTFASSNLLLPLPESLQYQLNFRMLSHDNSKTQLHLAFKSRRHTHSIQQRSLYHTSVGALHNDFCSNNFCFTSVVELTTKSYFHEQESPILTAGKIVSHALI